MREPITIHARALHRFISSARLIGATTLATAALTLLASPAARACSSCFSLTDRGREAYYASTVFLGLLPFLILGGVIFWLRWAAKHAAESPEGAPARPRADTAEQSAPS